MRVLTWNTQCGAATDVAVSLAEEFRMDAVLLQEGRRSDSWKGPIVGDLVQNRDWGSWILVHAGALIPIHVDGYSGWVIGARWRPDVEQGESDVFLFSLHSPTSSVENRRRGYVAESLDIVKTICSIVPAASRLVIGGDFNFKSLGERLATEKDLETKSERDAAREFRSYGLSIGWRDCHPVEPLPQTLRWKGNRETPYHCDAFLLRGFQDRSAVCEVISSESVSRRSDHNPVVLWTVSDTGRGRFQKLVKRLRGRT